MENSVKNKKTIGEVFGEVVNSEDKIKQTFVDKKEEVAEKTVKQKSNKQINAYIQEDIYNEVLKKARKYFKGNISMYINSLIVKDLD